MRFIEDREAMPWPECGDLAGVGEKSVLGVLFLPIGQRVFHKN